MNKKFKRTLAGLTAFLMAFSAAAIPQVADKIGLSITASASISGAYGVEVDGLEYVQFDIVDNIATVRGLRYGCENQVTEIEIPATINYYEEEIPVTSIRSAAFQNCKNLTKVTIPSSVTTIGDRAFVGCSSLASVEIAAGVETIGESAFQSCTSLTSIVIPESVTSIGEGAFSFCNELTSVSLPSTVTSIGDDAFSGLIKLATITVADSNPNYSVVENVLFNKNQTELILYPAGKTGASYSVPDTVTTIGKSAFYSCKLNSITIPKSVASIGQKAFFNCSFLTNIDIDEENTNFSFSNNLFIDETNKVLLAYVGDKTITSLEIPSGIITIGENALYSCRNLTSVTIPESVQTIGDSAFSFCESLAAVTIPNNVTSIGELAFNYCSSLKSIEIPKSVESIGASAFSHCDILSAVTLNEGITSIGQQAFGQCASLTTITIPKTVTTFGWGVFSSSGLTSAVFADGITTTGTSTFHSCKNLTSVEIPKSVTKIDDGVFAQCTGLTEYTIPDSISEIGNQVFAHCSNLKNVVIPSSVKKIGGSAFMYCTGLTEISIPKGVETIDSSAFNGCTGLKNITIPSSVKTIGVNAFYGCSGLETLTIPESLKDTQWLGLPEGIEIIISSNAVTFDSKYVSVTKSDSTPVESGAELDDGVELTITVTVPTGMKLNSVKANGETLTAEDDGTYKFTTSGGAAIVAEVQKVYKIDTGKIPEHVTLFKGENAVTADTTFVEGDVLTIKPANNFEIDSSVSVGNGTATVDPVNRKYFIYTFTGAEDNSAALEVSATTAKLFKVNVTGAPENIKLYIRTSRGQKSVSSEDMVDYQIDDNTIFYEGNILVIKIDEDCTVFGDVKVGDTTVTADENGEYIYTFTGDEDNRKPIVVSADVKKNTCEVTFSGMAVTKEDGTELESGDKVAEGTKLIISGWPSAGAMCKSGGFTVNGVAAEKLENGYYTYTVKAEDTKIEIKEIVYYVKDIEVTGLSDTYYVGDELEVEIKNDKVCIKGASIKFVFDDDSKSDEYPLYESAVKNFDTSKPNDAMKFTIDCGEDKKDITVKVVAAVPTKIEVSSNFKKLYQANEALDVSGGKITVTYSNGKTAVKDITADMVSGFNAEAVIGQKSLTITYTENGTTLTTSYTVDICDTELTVESISVSGYKSEYNVGDEFDFNTGYITVNYNSDIPEKSTYEEIGIKAAAEITGFDSSAAAETQTITVKYGGKETTFTVKIKVLTVTSAALTEPTKLNYKTGESLNLAGGKLTVVYDNGKIENIPLTDSRVSVTGFSSSAAGTPTITVMFGEISKTFSVSVTAGSSSGGTGGSSGGSGGSSGGSGGSSGGSGGSSTPVTPTIDGKEQSWTDVAKDIEKLTEDKSQTIDLNGGKTVPAEVIEAIAKSDAEVTFKVNDVFSWTIDGSEMDEKDAQKANLAIVKRNVTGTSELRGSVGTGFAINNTNVKSELNINFKATHKGEFANLFKKVDGKLVFVDNVKVDENGAAIGLEVSTSGEYVVMLGEFSDRAGDMDNDGITNAKDALAALKDAVGLAKGANPLVSDMNNDGFINAKDALMILKLSLGIID